MKFFYPARVNIIEHMNVPDSSALIEQCRAGNEQAIESLIRTYETNIFRLAFSIVQDSFTASEITQETFLLALKSLRTYQEKSSLKAWLYTITVNTSKSYLRKRKTIEKLLSTLTSIFQATSQAQPSPEEFVLQNERDEFLMKALDKLDEKHRMVVLLRYFQDLSVTEISEILSVSEGTIHSRLHYAREKLRENLSRFHGE